MKQIGRRVRLMAVIGFLLACTFGLFTVGRTESASEANGLSGIPTSPKLASMIAELEESIAGQEDKPAEAVFKNIKTLKGVPAGRLMSMMKIAFSGSLGVECTHCHIEGEWEKDEKPAKETARKMWGLMQRVNKDIKDTIGKGGINCTTCHRGQVKPALSLSTNR